MYTTISDFGQVSEEMYSDPATHCVLDGLDSRFIHGSIGFQKGNIKCAEYMSNRCAEKWDDLCEAYSDTNTKKYPRSDHNLTDGHSFIRDTAFKKYLSETSNCYYTCEAFNPIVANSPLVCYETKTGGSIGATRAEQWSIDGNVVYNGYQIPDNPECKKVYGFTEEQMRTLDSDPVMNKLLSITNIAPDLLNMLTRWTSSTNNWKNVYNTKFHLFAKGKTYSA